MRNTTQILGALAGRKRLPPCLGTTVPSVDYSVQEAIRAFFVEREKFNAYRQPNPSCQRYPLYTKKKEI
jgi:hypothetical protein